MNSDFFTNQHHDVAISASFWSLYCEPQAERRSGLQRSGKLTSCHVMSHLQIWFTFKLGSLQLMLRLWAAPSGATKDFFPHVQQCSLRPVNRLWCVKWVEVPFHVLYVKIAPFGRHNWSIIMQSSMMHIITFLYHKILHCNIQSYPYYTHLICVFWVQTAETVVFIGA